LRGIRECRQSRAGKSREDDNPLYLFQSKPPVQIEFILMDWMQAEGATLLSGWRFTRLYVDSRTLTVG
jgi:hypothetical protein